MKRYVYIIIGIVVIAVIAILVLLFIKSGITSPSTTGTTGTLPSTGTQGTGTPGTGNNTGSTYGSGSTTGNSSSSLSGSGVGQNHTVVQSFGVLSNQPVLDYSIDAENNITAIEPTGAVVSIASGQTNIMNSSTFNNIISASFSYDGQEAFVVMGNPASSTTDLFNVSTNAWTPLPSGMQSPRWSPTNHQIAYFSVTGNGKLSLEVIDATSAASIKKGPTALLNINADDLSLQWPTKTQFVLSDKPTSENAGSIWLFSSQTNALTPLVYEAQGAEALWSDSTSTPYGLVFLANPSSQNQTLQLQALSGNEPTEQLNFLTLPSKCLFNTEKNPTSSITTASSSPLTPSSSLFLYCGVPRASSGFSSANLPDDYNTMALFTSDDIYKINTATGDTQSLWSDPTQNVDVSDLKFFNNGLFFINRYDQKLYGLTFAN
jgi:hypothetical protein